MKGSLPTPSLHSRLFTRALREQRSNLMHLRLKHCLHTLGLAFQLPMESLSLLLDLLLDNRKSFVALIREIGKLTFKK